MEIANEHAIHPCHHMVGLVNGMADDTLTGPGRWYTRFHLMTCPNCAVAVKELRGMRERLGELKTKETDREPALTADRKRGLEMALDRIDVAALGPG